MTQQLILIRGLPGSGKSTLAKAMAQALNAVHLEADMYFVDEDGVYRWDREKLPAAHNWCQNITRHNLAAGNSVIVANTFTRQKELVPYYELAMQYQYETGNTVDIVQLVCRNSWKNIHGVSEETIQIMRDRWEE